MLRRVAWSFAAAILVVLLFLPRTAWAYPWMIRHEYTTCPTCHTDPSGGGLLTRYGRAQAAVLLSSKLGLPKEEEPGRYKDFLFGAVPLPESVDAQGWVRSAYLVNMSRGEVVDSRYLLMRADVGTHLRLGPLRASGIIGGASPGSRALTQEAWVTTSTDGPNVVSREHWLGVSLLDEAVLVRAGRLAMPFGLRNVEHTSWVRAATHTDTNQHQQHGVAAAYNGEKIRGEVMAVLGNYQLGPDAYRERGYSAFAEYAPATSYTVGVSSSILHAEADVVTRRPIYRQAHGVFGRLAPWKPLVVLAEADLVVRAIRLDNPSTDLTAMVQADLEALQGIHLMATAELLTQARAEATLVGGWLTAWAFLFAHMDARVDLVHRTVADGPATTSVIFQLHGWL